MKLYMDLKKIITFGGGHIFVSNIINKIISFFSVVIVARFLSKETYGVYGYCYNLFEFFILFQGCGLVNGVLQFCSETSDVYTQNDITGFAIKFGTIINTIIAFCGLLFSYIYNFNLPNSDHIFRSLIWFVLLTYITAIGEVYLRARNMNKKYALMTNILSVFLILFSIAGTYLFGLVGYIGGRYLAYVAYIFILFILLKKDILCIFMSGIQLTAKYVVILKYSIVCMLTNAVGLSLYLTDIFVIGLVCSSSMLLADYKVATQIPLSLYFITSSIMLFVYPYFAKNRLNFLWLKSNSIKLLILNFSINFIIGSILIVFSKQAIAILYGEKYLTIIPILKVLVISYIINTSVRMVIGNILASLRYVKYNLFSSIVMGLLNIILNYHLIQTIGAIGVAWSTLLVVSLSSIADFAMYLFVLNKLKKTVRLNESALI